jgi:hypothetical protein
MANVRQTVHAEEWGVEDMVIHNHELVREHIDDLLKEGAVLRAERLEAEHHALMGRVGARPATPALADVIRPARLRFGRWLVAIGWAVAGSPAEARGTTGHPGPVA